MKNSTHIQINIPNPCSEDWEQMPPCEHGRFCAHCQKQVIDFTNWSDTALYQFFSNNGSQVCGRFSTYQLNRPVYLPYQPHSRLYRMAIGLGLVLLFTQIPQANAGIRVPFATNRLEDIPCPQKDSIRHENIPATDTMKKTPVILKRPAHIRMGAPVLHRHISGNGPATKKQ